MKCTTPDIYFASFVMASGEKLEGAERDGRQVQFIFEMPEGVWKDCQHGYFGGDGQVKGMAMANAVKALKSLVHIT